MKKIEMELESLRIHQIEQDQKINFVENITMWFLLLLTGVFISVFVIVLYHSM